MAVGETLIPLNENTQRVIDVDDIERMSGDKEEIHIKSERIGSWIYCFSRHSGYKPQKIF